MVLLVAVLSPGMAELHAGNVRVALHPRGAPEGTPWPFTFGVPFPQGSVQELNSFELTGPGGESLPLQSRVSARWPDDSIKWALFDTTVVVPEFPTIHTLSWAGDGSGAPARAAADRPVGAVKAVREGENGRADIQSDLLRIFYDQRTPAGIRQVFSRTNDGGAVAFFPMEAGCDFVIEDADGNVFRARWTPSNDFAIEEDGPLRVVVKSEGWLTSEEGEELGRVILRAEAYAGQRFIRLFHTFVKTADSEDMQYRNIRMEWPFKGNAFAFHLDEAVDGEVEQSAALIQYRHNQYKTLVDGMDGPSGGRSDGWVTVGSGETAYSLAMRDFWQTFPNEIEVEPNLVNLHFWPRHGQPAPFVGAEMNPGTVGHLGWVHGGETLDFRLPEEFHSFTYGASDDGVRNARHANAMGIARTVEYAVFFHGGEDASAQVATFLARPMMVVDPAWLAASGAFWQIAERNANFREIEDAFAATLKFLPAMYEHIGDYGKWNYGAFHQDYNPTLDSAHLHRIWKGVHHGAPRWPWLHAVRSGDPDLYEWAITNANHTIDVGVCNWEDPEYNKRYLDDRHNSQNYTLKYLGGLNRYKGTVHWFGGQRMFYNAIVDFALWYYYLTGYQRAWDVAMNMGEFLVHAGGNPDRPNFNPYDVRLGTGRGSMAVDLYAATGDPRFEKIARNQMRHFIQKHRENPAEGYQQYFYAPFAERYLEVFDDPVAEEVVVQWARDRMAENRVWTGRDSFYNLMALAYQLSGDPEFLYYGLDQARMLLENAATGADPVLEGVLVDSYPGGAGYATQQWGDFMKAVRLHEEKTGESLRLPDIRDVRPFRVSFRALRSATDENGRDIRRLEFVTRKEEGRHCWIRFPISTGNAVEVEVTAPDGTVVERVPLDAEPTRKVFDFKLDEVAPAGDYRITFSAVGDELQDMHASWPFEGDYTGLVVAMPVDVRNAGRFYFLPKGSDGDVAEVTARSSIRPRYFRTHALYNPDGESVFRKTEQGSVNGNFNLPLTLETNGRTDPWLYVSSGLINSDGFWLEGDVHPHVAFSPDEFFVPQNGADPSPDSQP